MVCISYLDLGSPVRMRSLLRRLGTRIPDVACVQFANKEAATVAA